MTKYLQRFSYSDVLLCMDILQRHSGSRHLAYLIGLIGWEIAELDLRHILRYFIRRGTISKRQTQAGTTYKLSEAWSADNLVQLKMRKSREAWQNTWSVFTYDVPCSRDTLRRRLARSLRRMGFALMSRSSWVSPYDWEDTLDSMTRESGGEGVFSYVRSAEVSALGGYAGNYPCELWDLKKVATRYERIAAQCAAVSRGTANERQRVRARALLEITKALVAAQKLDPMLPERLMPEEWPGRRAEEAVQALQRDVRREVRKAVAG